MSTCFEQVFPDPAAPTNRAVVLYELTWPCFMASSKRCLDLTAEVVKGREEKVVDYRSSHPQNCSNKTPECGHFTGVKDEQFTLHMHCYVSSYCNTIMFLRVRNLCIVVISGQFAISPYVNNLYPPSLYASLQYESQLPVYTVQC